MDLPKKTDTDMSYNDIARLELLNVINGISTQEELNDFRDMLSRYFAEKAQKAELNHE